jgi:hypothetical protein
VADLGEKLLAVVADHFAEGVTTAEMDAEFMLALATLAATLIGDQPLNVKHRRAVFDLLVTKGLDTLLSDRLDKMDH